MLIEGKQIAEQMVQETAMRMCVAAATAPKARGRDNVVTMILIGEEKDALADKMDEIVAREFAEPNFISRDAKNLRAATAVVLIGIKAYYGGLNPCKMCGFASCEACKEAGGRCAISLLDMGIALGSAAALAADDRVDNRIMFSVGLAAGEMGYAHPNDKVIWHGIPLSVGSKSIFFDR